MPRRSRSTIRLLAVVGVTIIGIVACRSLTAGGLVLDSATVLDDLDTVFDGSDTVFDGSDPAVAQLDPALLGAVRLAAAAAADDGIEFTLNSGWRSPEDQERLFLDAVTRYGSEEEAARWVAPPNDSAHVSGDAVDIGGAGAAAWLEEHGGRFGLCRIYDNEPWHFELRPDAPTDGCPARYADATDDPRMHR